MTDDGRIMVAARPAELERVAAMVVRQGHGVCATQSSGEAAVAAVAAAQPELALVDLGMEDAARAARMLTVDLGVPVVYFGAAPDGERLRRAQAADPLGYVLEPIDEAQLGITLHAALATCRRLARPKSMTRFPSGRLLQTIFQSVNEGVGVVDTKGRIRYANPAAARLTGLEAPTGSPELASFRLLLPDEKTPMPAYDVPPVRALALGETSTNVEGYLVPPAGAAGFHVSVDAKPLYDDEGRRSGALVVFRDIGEHKAAEKKLRTTAERLAERTEMLGAVLDGIPDSLMVVDGDANMVLANPPVLKFLEAAAVPDGSSPELDIYHSDGVTRVSADDAPHLRVLRGESLEQERFYVRHPAMPGGGVVVSVSGQAVVPPVADTPALAVLLFRDVTAEQEQGQALFSAFAQGRLEVIDIVLHNVGNAVNSVATGIGTLRERLGPRKLLQRLSSVADALRDHEGDWLEYLRDDPQGSQTLPFLLALEDDWRRENVELQRTVERVDERVRHIVDILRGQQSFDVGSTERKRVRLVESVQAGVRILDDSLHARGIAIRVDCRRAPTEVVLQESRFQQMLVNLVRNGIEAIDARMEAADAGFRPVIEVICYAADDHLYVDVADNGIGIEGQHLEKVFTPGFTTKANGTGLGLHSAANYVMDSGGRIAALSDGHATGVTIRSQWPLDAMQPR